MNLKCLPDISCDNVNLRHGMVEMKLISIIGNKKSKASAESSFYATFSGSTNVAGKQPISWCVRRKRIARCLGVNESK